jgi:hypothetical protein
MKHIEMNESSIVVARAKKQPLKGKTYERGVGNWETKKVEGAKRSRTPRNLQPLQILVHT